MIEFTEEQIRAVWMEIFSVKAPEELTTTQVYEACLVELTPEILREALRCL